MEKSHETTTQPTLFEDYERLDDQSFFNAQPEAPTVTTLPTEFVQLVMKDMLTVE